MFGESLVYSFLPLGIPKVVQKEKLQSRERNVCARQTSFSAIFLLNKITAPIFQIIQFETRPSTLASTEVLNKGVRYKLVSRFLSLFGINVKERSPRNEIA